jgi:hypothetical protein
MSEPLSLWNLTLIDQVGTTEESEPQETAVRSRQNALLLAGLERGKSGVVHRLYYSHHQASQCISACAGSRAGFPRGG